MIKWIKYDPENPPRTQQDYLVLGKKADNDMNFCFVGTFKIIKIEESIYHSWEDNLLGTAWHGVTHYAPINLPGEE